MPQLPVPANTEDNNKTSGVDVIPEGAYLVALRKAEWKDAKNNPDNKYINCTFVVVEGPEKGMPLFDMFHLVNANPVAVSMSTKKMNQVAQAAGISSLENTDELLGIPILADVVIKPGDGDWPDKNEIKSYMPADGSAGGDDDWD